MSLKDIQKSLLKADDFYTKKEQDNIKKEWNKKYGEKSFDSEGYIGFATYLKDKIIEDFTEEKNIPFDEKQKRAVKKMLKGEAATERLFGKKKQKNMGGLLEDERVGYAEGPDEEEVERMDIRSYLSNPELLGPERTSDLENAPKDSPAFKKARDYAVVELNMSPDSLEFEINKLRNEERVNNLKGGQTKLDMNNDDMLDAKDFEMLRDQNAEGGDIDGQMSMLMMTKKPEEDMLPDDEMEDEYLDFILDEALDSEEEDYLMSQLQGNERLSEIFDKVIDIAQEFAGSGPVEGPGSGVSDSIPARLSDGEFVFTAKAVDEIGADKLMAMMKDAEMKADDRQGLANGGEPEEEDTVEMPVEKPATKQDIRVVKTTIDNGGKGLLDEDEISKSIKSKMMLDNRTGRHVQS